MRLPPPVRRASRTAAILVPRRLHLRRTQCNERRNNHDTQTATVTTHGSAPDQRRGRGEDRRNPPRARGEEEDDAVFGCQDFLDHVAVEVSHHAEPASGRDSTWSRASNGFRPTWSSCSSTPWTTCCARSSTVPWSVTPAALRALSARRPLRGDAEGRLEVRAGLRQVRVGVPAAKQLVLGSPAEEQRQPLAQFDALAFVGDLV